MWQRRQSGAGWGVWGALNSSAAMDGCKTALSRHESPLASGALKRLAVVLLGKYGGVGGGRVHCLSNNSDLIGFKGGYLDEAACLITCSPIFIQRRPHLPRDTPMLTFGIAAAVTRKHNQHHCPIWGKKKKKKLKLCPRPCFPAKARPSAECLCA